jgi:prolyl oligopeptidase
MRMSKWALGLAALAMTTGARAIVPDDDPFLWLTDVHGEKAQAWVQGQNAKSESLLKADPAYAADREAILKSLDTKDRIPLGDLDHGTLYNFWQDADHVRGLWRRMPLADYRQAEDKWEVLLDVDQLDKDEHKDWVFGGARCSPSGARCLVRLSPGGGDASEVREYDLKTHRFLADGFHLAVAKSGASYLDDDTVVFETDFGPGTLTQSSYPRIVKIWRRGQTIGDARQVFEVSATDISARTTVLDGPGGATNATATALVERGVTTFETEYHFLRADGSTMKLDLPLGADLKGQTKGSLIFTLRADWTAGANTYKRGSLIAVALSSLIDGTSKPSVSVLFAPDAHSTVDSVSAGREAVYASIYKDVTGQVHKFVPGPKWIDTVISAPQGGSTTVVSADNWAPGALFTFESFLVSPMLLEERGLGQAVMIRSQPPLFDARKMVSEQRWVTSKDGTKVPYFLIHQIGQKGPVPTILYSYGGFELSLNPWYWNDGHRPLDAGQVWLSKGGAIAVANIRGGGEFGPAWHQAALKENRQKAFDDFAAVATDLETSGFTDAAHVGIVGASNGGVLTTVTMTQHPELLRAVVCQRPLVDMLRYTRFGAGASWVGEYGDPAKPEERAYIEKYSAYQNVKPEVKYPSILFITETSDDRVTPIWARMMAAKMEAQGHEGVLFNESSEGGHGPGATNAAQADMWALSYVYLARELGLGQTAR